MNVEFMQSVEKEFNKLFSSDEELCFIEDEYSEGEDDKFRYTNRDTGQIAECHIEQSKYYNGLPNYVMSAKTPKTFAKRLHKFFTR